MVFITQQAVRGYNLIRSCRFQYYLVPRIARRYILRFTHRSPILHVFVAIEVNVIKMIFVYIETYYAQNTNTMNKSVELEAIHGSLCVKVNKTSF